MNIKQKARIDYNEGDIYKGEVITSLYAAKPDYLIFEGDNCGVVTITTENPSLRRSCARIGQKVSIIQEYLTTKRERRKFVDQTGLAYSEAIEGNIKSIEKICDKILERIELYNCNVGRFYYCLDA